MENKKLLRFLSLCYKHRIILIIDLICLLIYFTVGGLASHTAKTAYNQQEGKRWSSKGEVFHQVSAFWPESENVNKEAISALRSSIQRALLDASLAGDGEQSEGWTDAYAARSEATVQISSNMGTNGKENVQIFGVGGDFFLFHPLNMLSGSVFHEWDVMHDRVVIDRELAWTLYGGTKIEGQRLSINGQTFIIAGVYEQREDKYVGKATDGKCYLYMDYGAFNELFKDTPVTVYEAVIPCPVRTFAFDTMQTALGGEETKAVIVDNEKRFEAGSLLSRFADLPTLFMQKDAVVFPFWENEMRALEWKLFCFLVLRCILIMPPLVSAAFAATGFMRRKGTPLLKAFLASMKEKIRRRLYERPAGKRPDFEDEDF